MPQSPTTPERVELEKNLSPWQIWALALGCIIGWGCFVLPGSNFLPNAGPIGSAIGFFLGAILLVFVALSYGKMITAFPVAGGEFAYAYAGFGPIPAFICGWALVLGYASIIALNGTALAVLTRHILPNVFEVGKLYSIAGWDVYGGEICMVSLVLLFFGILNYRGGKIAGNVQLILAVILILGIIAFATASLFYEGSSPKNLEPYFNNIEPLAATATIIAIAPWLYVGFDTIPQAAEEFDFSPSKATMLMVTAILVGAGLYALVTLAIAYTEPFADAIVKVKSGEIKWLTGHIATLTMGPIGTYILSFAIIAAILTGINGFYIATSRLILSMARARFLPAWFEEIHPVHKTPANAILFTIIIVLLAPWFGRVALDWIVSMSAVGTVIAYGFTCLAAYRFAVLTNPPDIMSSKIIASLGSISSLICLGLLVIPGSPAFIDLEARYALAAWCIMGLFFYIAKLPELRKTTMAEMTYNILGKDGFVFFKTKD